MQIKSYLKLQSQSPKQLTIGLVLTAKKSQIT